MSVASLRCVAELAGHTDRVWSVAWSPDGQFLASCSGDKSIRVWRRTTERCADDGAESWECVAVVEDAHERTVRRVCWAGNSRILASASFDGTTAIWRLCQHNERTKLRRIARLEGHENEVKSVAFGAGDFLATCSRDKSVWIWDTVGAGSQSRASPVNDDEEEDSDDNGEEEDLDFVCLAVMHGHSGDVKHVAWHPERELLVSCSYDDTIKIWEDDGDDWSCSRTLKGHTSTVQEAAFDRRGQRLASVSDDLTLKIWDFDGKTFPVVCNLTGHHQRTPYSVDWSHESDRIATAAADNTVRVFARQPGSDDFFLLTAKDQAHGKYDVNAVRWHPSLPDCLASAGDDGLVRVWSLRA